MPRDLIRASLDAAPDPVHITLQMIRLVGQTSGLCLRLGDECCEFKFLGSRAWANWLFSSFRPVSHEWAHQCLVLSLGLEFRNGDF